MRKKYLLLVLMIFSLGLMACGKTTSVSETEPVGEYLIQIPSVDSSVEAEPETVITEGIKEQEGDLTFFAVSEFDRILVADGKNIREVEDESGVGYRIAMNESYIVFREYHYENENYYCDVILYDIEKREKSVLFTTTFFDSADIYQNILYVYGYDYSTKHNTERAYDLSTMEETDNNQALLDYFDGYQVIHYSTGVANAGASVKRMMDTIGYIPLSKDGNLHIYDGNEIKTLTEYSYWMTEGYFDKDKIIYSNPANASICFYDFDGDATVELVSDVTTLKGYKDGKVFFTRTDSPTYLQYHNSLYAYDMEKEESTELIDLTSVMGNYVNYPLNQGFTLYGDYIYFLWDPDGDVYWYRIPNDGMSYDNPEKTEYLAKENQFKGKGYKVAESKIYTCDSCDFPYYKTYAEYFVLDDSFVSNAATINKVLKTAFDKTLAEEESTNNQCETHEGEWGTTTYEMHINDVKKISESIVEIDYFGDWYGGGAHGMPFEWHRIFDTQTGQELKLADIYKGSEEEFKTVVAEKTRDFFNESEEAANSFFAADADSVYQEAYDSVYIESVNIEWEEDRMVIIFAPYEMGPYAAGFIYVYVDYVDLGIELY